MSEGQYELDQQRIDGAAETQETTMSTEELLKNAAIDGKLSVYNVDHSKHFAVLMLSRDEPEFPHTGKSTRFCTVHAETVLMYELEARAELIVRAVNSFAASQGLLRDAALQFARLEGENLTAYARTFAALAEKHLANNTEHTTK